VRDYPEFIYSKMQDVTLYEISEMYNRRLINKNNFIQKCEEYTPIKFKEIAITLIQERKVGKRLAA